MIETIDIEIIITATIISIVFYSACYFFRKTKKKAWSVHRKWMNYFLIHQNPFCSGVGIITFIFSTLLITLYEIDPKNHSNLILVLSTYLAVIGWMVHAKHASTIQRRQQAFHLLSSLSENHLNDFIQINKFLPPNKRFETKHMKIMLDEYYNTTVYKDSSEYPVYLAIMRIANSYELLATAARLKEIDRKFAEEYFEAKIVFFYTRCLPIIRKNNKEDSNVYNHIKWLVEVEWKNAFQKELLDFLENDDGEISCEFGVCKKTLKTTI